MLGNLGASLTSTAILYIAGWIKPDKISYPLLVGICFLLGCIWLIAQFRTMKQLETLPLDEWHIFTKRTEPDVVDEDAPETCLHEEEQRKI
jgi:hypothetical protein